MPRNLFAGLFILFYFSHHVCLAGSPKDNPLLIRYLGNMGIAVCKGDSIIIIDGLHDFYKPAYLPGDSCFIKSLVQFPKKTFICQAISHYHNDHFDSVLSNLFLKTFSKSVVIAPPQVTSRMDPQFKSRFGREVFHLKNLHITQTKITHINPNHASVENMRTEVVWNNRRIIHFGDAAISESSIARLEGIFIDVAVIPDWLAYSTEGQKLLNRLTIRHLVISHLDPKQKHMPPDIEKKYRLTLFENYGQSLQISP